MKKLTSILLSILLFCMTVLPFIANAGEITTPLIYCQGLGEGIYDENENQIYPISTPDGYISEAVKECMPYFIKAMTLGGLDSKQWDAYREKLVSYFEPLYTKLRVDGNGNPQYGTHTYFSWSQDGLNEIARVADGNYRNHYFVYDMDWRLDPYDNAASFDKYIDGVLQATGAEKVNIIARCQSSTYILAFLEKYKYDKVNCVEFYVNTSEGLDGVSAIFSGNMHIDSESLIQFINGKSDYDVDLSGIDPVFMELMTSTIELMRETYSIDAIVAMLNPILPKLYNEVVTECLYYSYGNFPGIFAMINAEDYEAAVKNIFKGREEENAGLIKKLNYYNTHVRTRIDDILLDAKLNGVKIAVFAKYGDYVISPPLTQDNEVISDGMVTVEGQSFGATVTHLNTQFSKSYLEKAEKNATAKYISADKKIDASTCTLPDTTWFFCNVIHQNFLDVLNDCLFKFLECDGNMTVFSNSEMPQYLYVISPDNKQSPLVPVNEDYGLYNIKGARESGLKAFFQNLKEFLSALRSFIPKLLEGIRERLNLGDLLN